MEMLLKEKDFRASLEQHDWEQYKDKQVAIFCSTDAIIPMWAYMLISSKLSGVASSIKEGTKEEVFKSTFIQNIQTLKEKGLSQTSMGRSSFAVLLFQDIAVIPILAIIPLLVSSQTVIDPEELNNSIICCIYSTPAMAKISSSVMLLGSQSGSSSSNHFMVLVLYLMSIPVFDKKFVPRMMSYLTVSLSKTRHFCSPIRLFYQTQAASDL